MYEDIYNEFDEEPVKPSKGKNTKVLVIISLLLSLLMIGLLLILIFRNKDKEEVFKMKETSLTMEIGETRLLEVVNNDGKKTSIKLTWSSNDNDIVTVDDNGTVTAVKSGKAIVTAKSQKNKTTTCEITVNEEIEPTQAPMPTQEPTATPKPTPVSKTRCCCVYNNLKMCSWRYNTQKCPSEQPFEDTSLNSCGTHTPSPTPVPTPTPDITPTPKPTVKYTVNFYDTKSHLYKAISVEAGKEIGTLSTPTRNGYKFDGWYTSNSGGTKVTTSTVVNHNTTLYAHWSGYYKYVFIIGVDGLGATWSKVSSPNFDSIFKNYAYRHNAKSESVTISAQNWGSILLGVDCSKHKITNNIAQSKTRNKNSNYLSIFYYVRKANSKAKLVSLVNWNPINHGIIETDINVNKIQSNPDSTLTNKVVDYLEKNKNSPPTLMFVHLDDVDHAAHATAGNCSTCGGFSTKYYNAAKTADSQLGKIYNKIKSIGILDDSLIIVVADHGETKKGHGGNTKEEQEVLLAIRGKTVNKMTLDSSVRNRDVAAIALTALGIDVPSHFTSKVPKNLFKK